MSSFGKIFKVSTFGESHGKSVGCVVEGVPSMMKLDESDLQKQMDRRRPGQNSLTTPRDEKDKVTIHCGTENGVTLGTPILITVANEDVKKTDYSSFSAIPRPGHADYTYLIKYGVASSSGGGRASARETIGRVCGGCIAEKYLNTVFNTKFLSWVVSVGKVAIPSEIQESLILSLSKCDRDDIDRMGTFIILKGKSTYYIDFEGIIRDSSGAIIYDSCTDQASILEDSKSEEFKGFEIEGEQVNKITEVLNFRCPHPETAIKMIEEVKRVKDMGDSIGGIAAGIIVNSPKALGEPCFEKFEALLAMAMLSLPATKGFEFGSGFEGTKLLGSQHNDLFECNEEIYKTDSFCTEIKSDLH